MEWNELLNLMNLEQRINILVKIGEEFSEIYNNNFDSSFPGFRNIHITNPWFTEANVKFALLEWSEQLSYQNLNNWISKYDINTNSQQNIKLGIIMAGNIPLVGLHDFICGFITGCELRIKLSSKDNILTKWLIDNLLAKYPELESKISYTEDLLEDFNAVIATGSNNSNRYFDYYFKDYNKILRKNRNSVAILNGSESAKELELLADDIFIYFGLGCRNISKLFLPKDYDFNMLGEAFQKYIEIIDHHKYANNFNYQYTILAMNIREHINTKNCLLVENINFHSPISIVNFEYYSDIATVKETIDLHLDSLQCIVTNEAEFKDSIKFGNTQKPSLIDYADNIDTINFLLNLKKQ